MAELSVEVWGTGERVVLVHGALATGPEEWQAQRPLADEGYQLVVPTRSAYADRPVTRGEDFLADGDELLPLLGTGAHLVGHSSGGLAALTMAAARPEAVRSLVLAEPPLFDVAPEHPEVQGLRRELESLLAQDGHLTDRQFIEAFLAAVGTPLEALPPELIEELAAMAPAVRRGRHGWDTGDLVLDPVAAASFPVVVVSGNHHPAFTAMAVALAQRLQAEHVVVEGAGHEVQMAAESFNTVLRREWAAALGVAGG